jgi:hypothetical protein
MRFARCVLVVSLLFGLGLCLGCGTSSGTGMRDIKMETAPEKARPEAKRSKDGKVVKELPPESDYSPEPPPLKR